MMKRTHEQPDENFSVIGPLLGREDVEILFWLVETGYRYDFFSLPTKDTMDHNEHNEI
jgi:hypothetical protein